MLIVKTPQDMKLWRSTSGSRSIGFVPTMGALHAGHADLLKRAREVSDIVVLSIFVNPTQFNDPKDLEKYPRTLEADCEIAQQQGVDVVFCPDFSSMYPDQYKYSLIEKDFSRLLCGKDRPGHFDGVLSVVMKLFNVVQPTRAFFGEKDYQQLKLIQGMVEAFFLSVEIVPVATVREVSGLAMSSRNTRLSADDKKKAENIFRVISKASSATEARKQLTDLGFEVDYVEDIDGRRFAAIRIGPSNNRVRLIDNVKI
jgi:pantoate--beta-alanine ligase